MGGGLDGSARKHGEWRGSGRDTEGEAGLAPDPGTL